MFEVTNIIHYLKFLLPRLFPVFLLKIYNMPGNLQLCRLELTASLVDIP